MLAKLFSLSNLSQLSQLSQSLSARNANRTMCFLDFFGAVSSFLFVLLYHIELLEIHSFPHADFTLEHFRTFFLVVWMVSKIFMVTRRYFKNNNCLALFGLNMHFLFNHIVAVGSQPHGLLAANHIVVGSQKHGCWQPTTWLLAVVGSQKHGCWQPKTWLLAAKNIVVGSQKHGCWQPKT